MADKLNLSQVSSKFSKLQQALIDAKDPEEKIEIMLSLCPEEEREEKRKELLVKLEERKKTQ